MHIELWAKFKNKGSGLIKVIYKLYKIYLKKKTSVYRRKKMAKALFKTIDSQSDKDSMNGSIRKNSYLENLRIHSK